MKNYIKIGLFIASTLFGASANTQHYEPGFKMPALNPKSPFAELSGSHVGIRVMPMFTKDKIPFVSASLTVPERSCCEKAVF